MSQSGRRGWLIRGESEPQCWNGGDFFPPHNSSIERTTWSTWRGPTSPNLEVATHLSLFLPERCHREGQHLYPWRVNNTLVNLNPFPNIRRQLAQRINGTKETVTCCALERTHFTVNLLPPISCFVNSRMESFQIGTTQSLGSVKTWLCTARGKECIRYTTLTQETSIKSRPSSSWLSHRYGLAECGLEHPIMASQ